MKIAIIGAGMIGKERIAAIEALDEDIVAIVDPCYDVELSRKYSFVRKINELDSSFRVRDLDWVFVCTPHHETVPIVIDLINIGVKNILVEKPLGRTLEEYYKASIPHPPMNINVGFNYRFLKGINMLLQDVLSGLFGDIISVNMVLGLSNSPGTEKTWRLDPNRAGSGSLIYAGIHLIDLAILMSNDTLSPDSGLQWSGVWNTGVEEEIHILATDAKKTIYNIQSSVNKWRSTFRVEVNGSLGYGIVEGRNRHFGNQRYTRGTRWAWMTGKSQRETEEIVVDYDGNDSFIEETKAVLYGTPSVIQPATDIDNRKCLEFIQHFQK